MSDLAKKALEIHSRLGVVYGIPILYFDSLDPLSELISSLLSHRTRNRDSGRAFDALKALYPSWDDMLAAPVADIESAIQAVTWPEQKAPRLLQVLRTIKERVGALSLDFLGDVPVQEARTWLEELPGVGPKTSAATLSFSTLRKAALPVDSHHYRVAVRTGLIGPTVSEKQAHKVLAAQLPPDWPAQDVYDNHQVMMRHGQQCCFHHRPGCERCPLLDICPTGQEHVSK